MNPKRRQMISQGLQSMGSLGVLYLLLTESELVQANSGAKLLGVRIWPSEDYTRITLESDKALPISHQLLTGPDRLVVDIDGLELNPTLKDLVAKVKPNDPYVAQIRVGQFQPTVVRLVFDLKEAVKPQLFTLEPIAEYQYRLIFDLYPTNPPDPLMQLVKESARKEKLLAEEQAKNPKGSAAEDDPIAAFAKKDTAPSKKGGSSTTQQSPLSPPSATTANTQRIPFKRLITVALDPGHGGEDPGAIGARGSHEKNIVLSIAKRLKSKIDQEDSMRPFLTRDGDYFVPLHRRVFKARQVEADLFISIHADAFIQPHAKGASVFALSQQGATSSAARWMANKENASDLIGGINIKTKDKQVAHLLLDMSTTAQINDSLRVGNSVLRNIGNFAPLHKNRVEQAGFAVLKAPDIPSILIETAFISNPQEEKRLNDETYQERIADAILAGIKDYFAKNPPMARRS
ncbi:N-acetylmuramoyl-L-alanine amidase [Polynucleobacter sp. HIN5]|uniref:N-acetylmuramoyl-L-alanine amidase n=1 Tax=Polynucleobacter sp. HIN5 TaxID=3047864 RepID=UPI002572EAF8|nr:N-acetylmuramoyl-L-alanine amidase [Polynucleobacter sp. HIN5]BEI32969.1 N-acetylmuramoyl-L-alanine amidase [Polynucleobacter sp. HIN5]